MVHEHGLVAHENQPESLSWVSWIVLSWNDLDQLPCIISAICELPPVWTQHAWTKNLVVVTHLKSTWHYQPYLSYTLLAIICAIICAITWPIAYSIIHKLYSNQIKGVISYLKLWAEGYRLKIMQTFSCMQYIHHDYVVAIHTGCYTVIIWLQTWVDIPF